MILTGGGKGIFNIFVGLLLSMNSGINSPFYIPTVGVLLVGSGFIFIFLSKCTNMSDETLMRATSINTKEV
jgi:hypothetical protein